MQTKTTNLFFILLIISLIFLQFCSSNSNKKTKDNTSTDSIQQEEVQNIKDKHKDKIKILFDASKAETAGNADWVIDADEFNMGFTKEGKINIKGSEANAQRFPNPSQNEIKASTEETFWTGALSAWAIDCVKKGYLVESLPYDGRITFGDKTNSQDLSNYSVFVICEPNIRFTKAEKFAIIKYVQNGGSLFIIADHDKSDRNKDGWDSPAIFNDLFKNNGIQENPFGVTFDLVNISDATQNVADIKSNEIINGPYGKVNKIAFHNGTSMTINDSKNQSVQGLVYRKGNKAVKSKAMAVCCTFGSGKVFLLGDSSCADDGTGDPKDKLYNGYTGDKKSDNQALIMNATIWLTK